MADEWDPPLAADAVVRADEEAEGADEEAEGAACPDDWAVRWPVAARATLPLPPRATAATATLMASSFPALMAFLRGL